MNARHPLTLALPFAGFGIAGWALENTLAPSPRYSALFGEARVPFLPIYAFGGTTLLLLAPRLRSSGISWPLRATIYAGILTALELAGCAIDRNVLGARSWTYDPRGSYKGLAGCVDPVHALLWAAAGLAMETLVT